MVGICIKYFHENYGGMLQAFATVSMLENRGLEYELIQYEKQRSPVTLLRSLPRLLNRVLLNDKYEMLLKKIAYKKHPNFLINDTMRMAAFARFKDSHFVKFSPTCKGYKNLCANSKRYLAVVTGSDQLWSPAGLPTNYYNLMFVPENVRKISYASSFGVKQIPWYQINRTRKFLNRIDYISMREDRGSEIVAKLTGINVPTILDPVFMFDKAGWERLIPVNTEVHEPYIFAYFLGNNIEHREAVKKLAQRTGLKVVALRHLDQYVESDESFGDFAPYDVGPDRFLNFIRGAKYVCTDSFHGACFSIIHNKQFVIFNRYSEVSKHSKNSRIDTLCRNFGLQDRRYKNNISLELQLTPEINYDVVQRKVNLLNAEANIYLDIAFKGIR